MTDAVDVDELDLTVDRDVLDAYEGVVPDHVAVIMDGNGRWARRRDMPRIRGHRAGADAVGATVEAARYLGLDVLTLYAFSSENWERPEDEVTGLMTLMDIYVDKERDRLMENDIRLEVIGDRSQLSDRLRRRIGALEEQTASNDEMLLQVAVSYGGREEIADAARELAEAVRAGDLSPEAIDTEAVADHLYTAGRPDPDLVVRTSGEMRLSNFLLWQVAYSELYVTETLWPDFAEGNFVEALRNFDARERRFGKTGEQIEKED
ncbi:MAG: isoprenyl transferase [Bradymonadaceae bacterium]